MQKKVLLYRKYKLKHSEVSVLYDKLLSDGLGEEEVFVLLMQP